MTLEVFCVIHVSYELSERWRIFNVQTCKSLFKNENVIGIVKRFKIIADCYRNI